MPSAATRLSFPLVPRDGSSHPSLGCFVGVASKAGRDGEAGARFYSPSKELICEVRNYPQADIVCTRLEIWSKRIELEEAADQWIPLGGDTGMRVRV